MKNRFLFTSLMLFFSTLCVVAQPGIEWQKSLGGSFSDEASEIIQTTDGGFILVGFSKSDDGNVTNNQGDSDYWVVKLNSSGAIDWQKSYGGSAEDVAYSIKQTTDGGYIIVGNSKSNDGDVTGNHGESDYWVIKLSSTGDLTWQKSFGGAADDIAQSVQQTAEGGYVIAGHSKSNDGDVSGNHGESDYWIVKLTSTGDLTWQKSYGGTSFDLTEAIQQTTDGGYIVAGFTRSVDGDVSNNNGNYDYWVLKIDSSGTITWEKSFGGTSFDYGTAVKQTSDGGFIVAGLTLSVDGDVTGNHGNADYWVLKLDSAGLLTWQKTLGGSELDYAYSIDQTNDGGYVVTGYSYSNNYDVSGNHGLLDYWMVRLYDTGSIEWQKCLGGSDDDLAFGVQETTDGGYIVAGYSNSNDGNVTGNHGETDFWAVKLESENIGVNEISVSDLLSIYPNPASIEINVNVSNTLSNAVYVIFDLSGKAVLNGILNETNSQVDLTRLSPGMYDIQIQKGDRKVSSRFVKK